MALLDPTLPNNNHVLGDLNHVGDHNLIATALQAIVNESNDQDDRITTLETAPTWTDLVLENGYTNYGGVFAPAGVSVDALGRVQFRGLVKVPATGVADDQTIATIPDIALPGYYPRFSCTTDIDAQAKVSIKPGGTMALTINTGGDASFHWLFLDQITYLRGQ